MKKSPIFLITGLAFFIAEAKMPPPYYQLLNLLAFGTSIYGMFLSYRREWLGWSCAFGTLALMFNPLVPLRLLKEAWHVVDLVSGAIFCIYYFIKKQK